MAKNEVHHFQINVPEKLMQEIREIAAQERRTLSGQLILFVEEALSRRKNKRIIHEQSSSHYDASV